MKVIDRYLVRELVIPIIYASVILVFLILIADLFNNLDDLLKSETPLSVVGKYYLCLVPYSLIQILPWATWLGTLFLLVHMGLHNEMIAMKAAGLKITSIIKPVIFLGFLIGITAFLISDQLVPPTLKTANELRTVHIERKKEKALEKVIKNVTYYSGQNQLYFVRSFATRSQELTGVVMLWLNRGQRSSRKKIVATSGSWQENHWEFKNVTEYQMDSQGRVLGEPQTYAKKVYSEVNFSPMELLNASSDSSFLSYKDLKNSMARLKENGVRVYSENVDLHYRLASPWQGLVMMLTVIPLLARTANRKLIAFRVLICIGVVFAFHVTGAIGLALGKAGKFFPFVSAWIANIAFALGSIMYLEKANY